MPLNKCLVKHKSPMNLLTCFKLASQYLSKWCPTVFSNPPHKSNNNSPTHNFLLYSIIPWQQTTNTLAARLNIATSLPSEEYFELQVQPLSLLRFLHPNDRHCASQPRTLITELAVPTSNCTLCVFRAEFPTSVERLSLGLN